MQSFLRQRLMIMSTKLVIERSLLLLFIVYRHSICEVDRIDHVVRLLFVFKISFCKFSSCLLQKSYWSFALIQIQFCLLRRHLTLSRRRRYSVFWFFVNHIEREFSIVVLELYRIRAISRSYVFVEINIRFAFENILIFERLMLCIESDDRNFYSRVISEWFEYRNLFHIEISTNCANFFNHFDVFDLPLSLWIVENWNNWRLLLKMSTRSNAKKSFACINF